MPLDNTEFGSNCMWIGIARQSGISYQGSRDLTSRGTPDLDAVAMAGSSMFARPRKSL